MRDEVDYFSDLQFGHDYDEILKALQSLNEGRNLDCFPVASFGWKDADLEPSGCTGISKIVTLDDYRVVIEVGGHKTFSPAENDDEELTVLHMQSEIISSLGYPANWTGDDWSASMESTEVKVDWVLNDELEPDYIKTAENIIKAAKEAVKDFQDTMQEAAKYFDEIGA